MVSEAGLGRKLAADLEAVLAAELDLGPALAFALARLPSAQAPSVVGQLVPVLGLGFAAGRAAARSSLQAAAAGSQATFQRPRSELAASQQRACLWFV